MDCLLSQDDTDTRPSTISIENHNRYVGMIKLFTIISVYEMISLLCILAKTCSMESALISPVISPVKILTASGYIQVLAWTLMMVLCCRLYHLQKAPRARQEKQHFAHSNMEHYIFDCWFLPIFVAPCFYRDTGL